MFYLFKSKFFYFLLVSILLPIQITLGIYLYFAPEIPSSSEVASVELQVPLKIFTKDGKAYWRIWRNPPNKIKV